MKLDAILARAFRTTDPVLAFEHFRRVAADVAVPDGYQLRKDAALARHNVARAMVAMTDRLPVLARTLPTVDVVGLAELPALALAVLHATDRVPAVAPSAREIDAALAVIRPLRASALAYLEVAARLGIVPARRVMAIRAGSGKLDQARDAVALVALFREYADALAGRHPFTDVQFKTLADHGAWLVQSITPARAVARTPSPRRAELRERDRLVKLLEQRYDQLRTAGVVCFGLRDVDAHVPPLWSAKQGSAAPAPSPAP